MLPPCYELGLLEDGRPCSPSVVCANDSEIAASSCSSFKKTAVAFVQLHGDGLTGNVCKAGHAVTIASANLGHAPPSKQLCEDRVDCLRGTLRRRIYRAWHDHAAVEGFCAAHSDETDKQQRRCRGVQHAFSRRFFMPSNDIRIG